MKGYRRFLTFILALIMVVSSFSLAFASGMVFTDISNHWAKEYIEDIYNRGITKGYPDATFNPTGNITKPEVIAMVANLLGYNEEQHKGYSNSYSSDFATHNIPAWAYGQIAYAINQNILSRNEIISLTGNARRHEVVVYIGRVLEHHANEALRTTFVLPYQDEMTIPQTAKTYIDLLLRNDILNPNSNEGRFLSNNLITRGEVAKMISEAAAILDAAEDTIIIVVPQEQDGIFLRLMKGNRTIISVLEEDKEVFHDVASNVSVELDDRRASITDLEQGHFVKLEIRDNEVVSIKATSNEEVLEGRFSSFVDGSTPIVTLRDKDNDSKVYKILSNTIITLDDKDASLRDFRNGDEVKAILSGDYVVSIEGTRRDREVEGVITAKGPSHRPTLDIKTENGEIKTFALQNNASIRRNNRTASFQDLRLGDEVTLQLEYEEIKAMTVSSVRGEAEGIIRQIVIGDEMKVTVRDRDGNFDEYIITSNTIIRLDGARAEIYDLRLHYDVEMDLENNEVTRLNAESFVMSDTYVGRVTEVIRSADVLEMEIDGDKILTVNLTSDTAVMKGRDNIRLRDIRERDRVTVIGQQQGSVFLADMIIVH